MFVKGRNGVLFISVIFCCIFIFGCNPKNSNKEISEQNSGFSNENWGYNYLKIDELRIKHDLYGKDSSIGLIDTGVSSSIDVVDGINTIDGNNIYEDNHGHGTHIAGIIKDDDFGVSPKSDIYAVKALDENMNGDIENIILGIDWLIDKNVDIILLPFGTVNHSNELEEVINKAYEKNIIVVSSTGNYGLKEEIDVLYPAKYENVIGVGALSKEEDIWIGTTLGEGLDVLLPGQEIRSLSLNDGLMIASGTSMASAYMAGFLALYIEYSEGLDKSEIKKQIFERIDQLPVISKYGKFEVEVFIK